MHIGRQEGIVTQLEAVAEKKGCSAAQLAIALVLKQGPDLVSIPGINRIKYLEEYFGALKVGLTDEEAEMRRCGGL
ncbi:uncharacterized protein PG986_005067 [Apiospora aurea]|uniref:NADP-dependent oxidoreductase domain-containing protein n=1 Tax=Apiospora aurea TaxID=335848 RepID=A0ABR1QGJ1_9PEZI